MSKKNLKKALIPSLIALVLCFAMLLGTTFAWFTDTADAGTSVIKSGTLDIELKVKTIADDDYVEANANNPIFNYELWEPGYLTYAYAQVENVGTLALKYNLVIVPVENGDEGGDAPAESSAAATTYDLADVIEVWYAADEVAVTRDLANVAGLHKLGTLAEVLEGGEDFEINDYLLAGETDKATIVLYMPTDVDDHYQGLSVEQFTIKIVATQYTYEEDAFDNSYDAAAEFPTD